jgi:hypothetical protein
MMVFVSLSKAKLLIIVRIAKNLPSGNTLKLVSYTSKTDRKKFSNSHPEKRYQEAFFQGRYSLTYSTYIYYPTTNDSVVNDRGSIGGVEYLPLQRISRLGEQMQK